MKLIDRYVAEVGKSLLLVKGRKDIEKELRSTLEDMLEERARNSGKPADEIAEMELLREYGAPSKVAATYNPNPYLIGPRLFPIFTTILKIVIGAVTLGMTIVAIIQIVSVSPATIAELFTIIGRGFMNIVSACIAAFGNLALIFALIERYAPVAEFKMDNEKEWDPASLTKEPEPQDVKIWEPIIAIVLTFIAISIVNFNPEWLRLNYGDNTIWFVGFGDFVKNQRGSIPLFSEAFFRWLPLLNIGWAAEIILNGMLLRTGRWQASTRLFSIVIKLFQIVVISLFLSGPSILGITPESLVASGVFEAESAQHIGGLAQQGIRFVLGIAIFGTVVDIVKTVYKLVTQKNA
ncbi:MAG: hypothetical protein HYZ23_10715 [Chloroflexi bacterium]|nr:hypothetical protein [Chloroflexota bacterium]